MTLIDIPAMISAHFASVAGLLVFTVAGAFWNSIFSKPSYRCTDQAG